MKCKRSIAVTLAAAAVMGAVSTITSSAYALSGSMEMVSNGVVDYGNWEFAYTKETGKGILTLTGDGSNLQTYSATSNEPWAECIPVTTDIEFIKIGSISPYAFKNYSELTNVNFDNSLWYIKEGAFYNCDKLTKAVLPASVIRVHPKAFADCDVLKDVYFTSAATFYSDTFDSSTRIHYPVDDEMYQAAKGWGDNIILDDVSSSTAANINDMKMTVDCGSKGYLIYNGKAQKPSVKLTDKNGTVVSDKNYTVSYTNNKNVGTATVTVKGTGNGLSGTLSKTFMIRPKNLTVDDAYLSTTTIYYNTRSLKGAALDPAVITDLPDTEYRLEYSHDIGTNGDGKGSVKVIGKNNHAGTLTLYYNIKLIKDASGEPATKIPLTYCKATLSKSSYTYNGKVKKPAVTITYNGIALKKGTDYTIKYKSNKNAGTGYVVITAKGGKFSKSITKIFTIKPKNIKTAAITSIAKKYAYTSSNIKPSPEVIINGKKLVRKNDYTVSYKSNKGVGTASLIIKGKGNYKGTITKTFKIVPKTVKGLKATSATSTSISLKWNKVSDVKGYYVYKYNSANKSWTRIKTVSGTKRSCKITGLKPGKTYKFAVKAYKKIAGTTYTGLTSKITKKTAI